MSRCQRPRLCRAGVLSAGSFTAEDIGPQPERQDGHKVWIASQRKGHDDATLRITGPDGQARSPRAAKVTCVLGRRCRTVLPRESFRHHERYLSAPNQGRTRHDVRESPLSGCRTSHRRWQDQDRPRRVAPITCTCMAPRRSIDQKDTAMRFRSSTKRGRPGEAHHVPHCRRPTAAADSAMRSDWVRGPETWQGKGS